MNTVYVYVAGEIIRNGSKIVTRNIVVIMCKRDDYLYKCSKSEILLEWDPVVMCHGGTL